MFVLQTDLSMCRKFSHKKTPLHSHCITVSLSAVEQGGERINVAVKTCKDSSPDVMEKFMSEAGNQKNV